MRTHFPRLNNSGFMLPDFLFSFVMVIGVSIFIFALTFSLAAIEVAQYIVWSTARNYSAAAKSPEAANELARIKFDNLTAAFPLLTGAGEVDSPWFLLPSSSLQLGDLSVTDQDLQSLLAVDERINNFRQPWTGASARLTLRLFSNLKVPFLGSVAGDDKSIFEFPVRAFIIRHPSQSECRNFFYSEGTRYTRGIKQLEGGQLAPQSAGNLVGGSGIGGLGEDNGC